MAAPDDLKNILGPNEKVELYIKEKIYHPQISIDSVIITNGRVILRHPHALRLKKDYTDYSYQDITNVVLDKGILRSKLKLTIKRDEKLLELGNLPNSLAEKAYGIIRENLGRFQAPFATGYANAPPNQQGSAPAGVPSTPAEGQKPQEETKKTRIPPQK